MLTSTFVTFLLIAICMIVMEPDSLPDWSVKLWGWSFIISGIAHGYAIYAS